MNILTFDIEEWFHILDHRKIENENDWAKMPSRFENNLNLILDILDESNCIATFFCLGWIVKKYPKLIKKISDRGFELASHSYSHKLAYKQSALEFRNDLKKSINIIEDICGIKINTYRAPGFSITEKNLWQLDILIEEGIEVDCSIFSATRNHGGLPNAHIIEPVNIITKEKNILKELPINSIPIMNNHIIFSGGGYFRLIPYFLLSNFFKKSKYVMTYFHPRDFDTGQPIIKDLSIYRKFCSYYGIKNSKKKLIKLLSEFKFYDVRTAVKNIEWSKIKRINI